MRASRYPEAAFLAAMTASATHEVRNVLAIIKESAGLIEDLVLVFQKRGTIDQEKVNRAVARIETQVKRGADLLTNLNRLSHTLDEDEAGVELNQELEQVVFLSQRFARKRGHEVVAESRNGDCLLVVNPLRLHMALFAGMECCLEELPEGSTITVGAHRGKDGPVVEYRGTIQGGEASGIEAPSEAWQSLVQLADSMGATPHRAEVGYGLRILFHEGAEG